ncbi:unnamed protein product [Adineta ricciae]|uniref:Uncharacterized protein n=1 Tax=Adineta ricciae TaxID=249248 RepID=A0A813SWD1_ADIRI|nr:unnamed protein product [Adineta ricciae]CAF1229183.1 unnamed protein product [Adineta ricciae]
MSDTSVVSGDYPQNDFSQPRPGCWTTMGANICVMVLAVITILLTAFLIFVIVQHPNVKNKKNGGFLSILPFGNKLVKKGSNKIQSGALNHEEEAGEAFVDHNDDDNDDDADDLDDYMEDAEE